MPKYFGFIYLMLLFSCSDETVDLSGNTPLKPNQFINAFKPLGNNLVFADSNILKLADTHKIAAKVLSSFLPDSLIKNLLGKDKKTIIYPVGRIEKQQEVYLLLALKRLKNLGLYTMVFDKKNNGFLQAKELIKAEPSIGNYNYVVSINREPTFTISREKTMPDKDVKYSRTGWAYSAGQFIAVVNESNERSESSIPIINPIDTLPRNNPLSGLYGSDSRNFISIRDGKTPQQYLFFLHIEKEDGKCIGELKGEMKCIDATHAVYAVNGDPCAIDFSFEPNEIAIKEKGSCGNRRGMDCFFEDIFRRKKEAKRNVPAKPVIVAKPTQTKPKAK